MTETIKTSAWHRLSMMGVLLLVSVPLLIFAYGTQFIRFMADDFCLGPNVSFADMLHGDPPFHPILALFDYPIHLMGIAGASLFCLLFLLIFEITLFLVLLEIAHNKQIALVVSLLFIGIVLACATNLYQSVYWPVGMVENLVPLILGTFLVWLLLQQRIPPIPSLILCFVLAFLGGSIGNAFPVGQVVLLGIFWLAFRNRPIVNWRLFLAGVGAVLAVIGILLFPGTQERIASSASIVFADPSVVSRLFHGFIRGFKDPLIYTFARAPLAFGAALLLPFLGAQYTSINNTISKFSADLVSNQRKRIVAVLAAVGLPIAALLSCIMMWGAGYVTEGRLPTRTWMDGQFFLIAACIVSSYILGLVFKATFSTKLSLRRRYSMVVAGLIMIAAFGNETIRARDTVIGLQSYSIQADIRDAQLRAGVLKVAVLNSFGLNDLDVPWVSLCMKNYYQLPIAPQPAN